MRTLDLQVWGRAASATAIGSVAGLTFVGFPHAAMAAVLAARVAARNVRRVNIVVPTLPPFIANAGVSSLRRNHQW